MHRARRIIERLLALAGVHTNGNRPWDIQVHDERLFPRILREGNLGMGEAYMDGWWDCERIDEMICRVLKAQLDKRLRNNWRLVLSALPDLLFNLQTRNGARHVARRHYDLGNDLFGTFLDRHNLYSCAYFKDCDDLDQAQQAKMELIAAKLSLAPGLRVLDIGCGWGGLARYLASEHGTEVTAVNISREQVAFASQACQGLPVSVQLKDYRDVDGSFDRIVSVGMFEHVGIKNYRTFMETCHQRLKDGGSFLLHTIGGNESMRSCDPWIRRYIFPRGMLPSIKQIAGAAEGLFVVEDWHNLGTHYDKTLMAWHRRFSNGWENLKERYTEDFRRMWEYYLLSCAGAFRARDIQLWQIVFTKPGTPQPPCRQG
ncbi:MAG: cyclopropane fatty acyl phospholipid synthase [Proteobacteria bacterium]|nr:cyclopropane fatty acyl phospholipid synthase [Pseudomonadota bacterium]